MGSSKLILKKYEVKKLEFEIKESKQTVFKLSPKIQCEIKRIDNTLDVILGCHIESSNEEVAPFNLTAVINGVFEEMQEEDQFIDFKENAVAILYPYLRSLVASVTTLCEVATLNLPIVNVTEYLQDKNIVRNDESTND